MKDRALNLAGSIAEYFIISKLTILFAIASILLGVIAILLTPREENPQILVPCAEVFVSIPGASSQEVEELILYPLEAAISELTGIDHIYGNAMNSACLIVIEFEVGQDKEESLTKLYDKVMRIQDKLPPNAGPPIVKSVDVDDVPIVTITLASEIYDDYALKRLADHMVERLHSLSNISLAYVKGGRNREIRIEIDPEHLEAFGITMDTIHASLSASNLSSPLGTIVISNENHPLFLNGFLKSAESVARLIVGIYNERPVYIEDIANIIDGPPVERKRVSRFAFGPADPRFGKSHDPEMPAVTIAVAKKKGVNAVFAANDICERVERMKNKFLPSEAQVIITRNDGANANDAVNKLIEHLGIAIIIVFCVIALFLGFREAVITGVSVPLILSLTLGGDLLFGLTINRMTLFGIIVSLGLMVDASIVVIENINRHFMNIEKGDKKLAAVLATNEIGNPTNLATIGIMLVFSSLIMLTDMSGPYIFPITFNAPTAMLASLLVAYIITPWAAYNWLKTGAKHHPAQSKDYLKKIYYKIITPLIDKPKARWILFLIIILLTGASFLQPLWQFIRPQGPGGPISYGGVGVDIMPKDDKNTFNITIDMPEFTPIEMTDQIAREIGQLLRQQPRVTNYQIFLGSSGIIDFSGLLRGASHKAGSYVAEIRVNLVNKNLRHESSVTIVRELRPAIEKIRARYPGCTLRIMEDPPGPPVHSTIRAEIYGPDLLELRHLNEKVTREFQKTYDIIEINDSEAEDVREYQILVDKEKAALSGIATSQIALALKRIVDGDIIGRIHMAEEKNAVPISLNIPRKYQIDPILLAKLYLTNAAGTKIPVSELTRIIPAWQDRLICHKDNERVTYVGAAVFNSSPFCAVVDLDQRIDGMAVEDGSKLTTGNLSLKNEDPDTIDGYRLLWDGEMRLTLDIFRDLGFALLLSLTAIYLLLVGYYRSFMIPVIAMVAIPLGFIGIFPGHWITGEFYSMPSNIGLVALAGVVTRSSLLIIDFILGYLEEGYTLREAVCEAGAVRLRPIMLTALAIITGTSVMMADFVFRGMAISLIFGTITSTIFTIMVVPVLMFLFLKRKEVDDA
ncbi:MAG: efflux RND transporter permease subunit [Desulfosarcina sp.]|nr:efflux RND transporter permease subunit [Desulfobacterales bacterium]